MAQVGVRGIVKSFGKTAVLKDVSLNVPDGAFVSLLGPSGCGKTTLLRIIAGLEGQDAGDVFIGTRMVDDLPPKARDIAFVFQSYALYPYMSVRENIGLPLEMRRLSAAQRLPLLGRFVPGARATRTDIAAEVRAVADALSIGHLLDRKPGQLSGGQRQRVALARAMVRQPAAFLMDEPLSNLDAKLRVQARGEIADVHRRLGATFVYVTHDQSEAMALSDRVAVMLDGDILQYAAPRALYADPVDLRVARFVGTPEIAVLEGVIGPDGRVRIACRAIEAAVAASPGATVQVGIRAEAAVLDADGLPGKVAALEHMGADLLVKVAIDDAVGAVTVRTEPADGDRLRIGEAVHVRLRPDRALFFDAAGRRLAERTPAQAMPHLREVARG
jgi:multiple sugar transport system ATP-binding protein